MDGGNRVDDQTFRANFTGDGVAKLRERVKEKLKDFMGEYTDDTLVEYVIVLLKNGRRKEEARNELNVFLGDDSDSFVSWLWDHLGSNLGLYVQPRESHPDDVARLKPMPGELVGGQDSHHVDFESEIGKSNTLSKSRHNREWKGLVSDADDLRPLKGSETDNIPKEESIDGKVGHAKRSISPRPTLYKKRSRPEEHLEVKKEGSRATIGAPRRLLQFAVRDAVTTSRPSNLPTEPSLKRLRSVVSTSTRESPLEDRPQRFRSVTRVPHAMATAIKAVAEAAKDVVKVRSSGNVFDRLGRGMDVSDANSQLAEFREAAVEVGEGEDYSQIIREEPRSTYLQRSHYSSQYVSNITGMGSDTAMASDSASDNEGYDKMEARDCRVMGVPLTGISDGNKGKDSLMVQYSVTDNADESTRTLRRDQDPPAAANNSRKIVNISVNVNTWKPPHFQQTREVTEMDNRKSVQESEAPAGKSGVQLAKENSNHVTAGNGNAKPLAEAQKVQKTLQSAPGPYSTGRPTEDADSRTIFVNNVHFAATKDSLSRHFNKFGEVLKVVIITDAATGQPKGSAYIEFLRKEAAEHALSLDGTSFMSRILKIVRKSSAHQEAASVMMWPPIARGSPFAAPRFARVPFPRGIPSVYRARLPIKPGARSLQWKRDAPPSTPTESSGLAANSIPSPTARSLTYVRPEAKAYGNPGTA
ncbi:unnamed protein product [Ilex paraguariensis]|uniref:RRM domain-containing protein n=1 Tax=Ilex paraguariensis TaxID=185542 RepID=A0ABC8SIH7_9AQUA